MPLVLACRVPWCAAFQPCPLHPVAAFAGTSPMGPGWSAARSAALVAAGYRCQDCGGYATEVHHIVPRARGGSDEPGNLVALCGPCHHRYAGLDFGAW